MTDERLERLVRRLGIEPAYAGPHGEIAASEATLRSLAAALLGERPAPRRRPDEAPTLRTLVSRRRGARPCWLPGWLEGGRGWGIFLQLYELRSARNWGIGDFADLAAVCRIAAGHGADFLGTNPLHALFLADPGRCSPFSPSNRLFVNPLYIAVDRVEGFEASDTDPDAIARLREANLVDYPGVATVKLAALKALWRRRHGRIAEDAAFRAFAESRGRAVRSHALFECLSAHMVAAGHGAGWTAWPEEYRHPEAPAVRVFADEHADEAGFHLWLQYLADVQLRRAQEEALAAGMRLGLYLDLAVGEAPDGSASWSDREAFVEGFHIGAPPDVFSEGGQDWGLAPPNPVVMREQTPGRMEDLFSAWMARAGALRIDHAMALWHLFLVPSGHAPAEGAFVRLPTETLLDLLSALSGCHGTVIVGEDLGHVPSGFREAMEAARILSYRILYFEQERGGFRPPHRYPRLAMACLSTHDLATLAAWWRADDVRLRAEHGLVSAEAAAAQAEGRDGERRALVAALRAEGLLDPATIAAADAALAQPHLPVAGPLATAAHRFIARTPSLLVAVRLADLTGETAAANVPGTIDAYPNWRVKCSVPLEELAGHPRFRAIVEAVAAERPREPA